MTIELMILIAAAIIVATFVGFEMYKNRKEKKLNSGSSPTDGGNDTDGRGDNVERPVAPSAFSIPLTPANVLSTTPVFKKAPVKKPAAKKVPAKKKPTRKAVVKKKTLTKTTKR